MLYWLITQLCFVFLDTDLIVQIDINAVLFVSAVKAD